MLGTLLLIGGVAFIFGYFLYPEYFLYGAGLAGIAAVLAPVGLTILGFLLIYGSFGRKHVPGEPERKKTTVLPPPQPSQEKRFCANCGTPLQMGDKFCGNCGKEIKQLSVSDVLVDEWIDEQGAGEEEISYCKRFLHGEEKLWTIVAARGAHGLNRLALTDRRIILYPRDKQQDFLSFNYWQISDFRGNRNAVLLHLGEIILSVEGKTVKLGNVGTEYVKHVIDTIATMKTKTASATVTPAAQEISGEALSAVEKVCLNCGYSTKVQDRFCNNCGAQLQ